MKRWIWCLAVFGRLLRSVATAQDFLELKIPAFTIQEATMEEAEFTLNDQTQVAQEESCVPAFWRE